MTLRCGAKTRQSGEPCKLAPGAGTDHPGIGHCKFHGGSTPSQVAQAARIAGLRLAESMDIAPHDALLANLAAWNGIAAFFTAQVADLEQIVISHRKEKTVTDGDGDSYVETSTEARLHILVHERHNALVERGRAAKLCVDANVEERAVALAERDGARIADAFAVVLDAFGVRQDPRAPEVIRQAFTVLEGGKAA